MKKKVLYIGIIFFLLFINVGNVEGIGSNAGITCVYNFNYDSNGIRKGSKRADSFAVPTTITITRSTKEKNWKASVTDYSKVTVTSEYDGNKCPEWIGFTKTSDKKKVGEVYLPGQNNDNAAPYKNLDYKKKGIYILNFDKSKIPENKSLENDNTNNENDIIEKTYETINCGDGMEVPVGIPRFVASIVTIIKYLVPVALIAMCIYDFIKAIITSDQTIIKNTIPNIIRRLIGAIAVFFVLAIVQFLFGLVQTDYNPLSCVQCFITGDC